MDESTRQRYEAREAWLKDEATQQYEARMVGIKEGRMEGEATGRKKGEIATKLSNALALLDILDDVTIAAKIALPIEVVKRLRAGELESIQAELLADGTAAIYV